MYKMIVFGGKYYALRIAYLFAKEFDRDFTIHIKYEDGSFINEYVENGGSKDLMCFIKYFE